jgi:ribonuclease R
MLRSMERARYSAQNLGHFGLAMDTYTHFTSPIRRYPDLMVHRILREVIKAGHNSGKRRGSGDTSGSLEATPLPVLGEDREQNLRKTFELVARHSSERERAADEAENELIDWRKAEFMAEHVGETFDGVIASVKAHGFYVELNEFFVEGLVHVSTLDDDVYEFQERKHKLVGQRSGREFGLGSAVRVVVDRVDRSRHLIDFSIAE